MQIAWIKPTDLAELRDVGDDDHAIGNLDQPIFSKKLYRTIDVNRGEPERIGDLLLRQGEAKADFLVTLHREANAQLAQKMCKPLDRRPSAKRQCPLAENCIFNQAKPSKSARDPWMLLRKGQRAIPRHRHDLCLGDRPDAIVKPIEHQRVEIADVAWHQQGRKLPAALPGRRVPTSPALDDNEQRERAISLAH